MWAFSLYKLEVPEAPTDNSEYLGCYRDTRDDRVMTDKTASNGMDPVLCREYCVDRDALYYGTQVKGGRGLPIPCALWASLEPEDEDPTSGIHGHVHALCSLYVYPPSRPLFPAPPIVSLFCVLGRP